MVELAAADAVHQLDDAPEPINVVSANSIDGTSLYVRRLFNDDSSYSDDEIDHKKENQCMYSFVHV